jgi:hypothetical protein
MSGEDGSSEDAEEEAPVETPQETSAYDAEMVRLQKELKEPFKSPEEAGMRIATILARIFEQAVGRHERIYLSNAKRPNAKIYWSSFFSIMDSGVKVIGALRTAYEWDETIKKLKMALEQIKKMRDKGLISEKEYQEVAAKVEEAEIAAKG